MKHLLSLVLLVLIVAACGDPSSSSDVPRSLEVDLSATSISRAAPFEVTFTADSATSDSLAYTWDYGDLTESVAAGRNPTRTYLHPGSYSVSVMVSDGTSTASDSLVINVLEPRYYGNWIWVAMYPDDSFYRGVLNITLAAEDGEGLSDTSVGVASLEYSDGSGWDEPIGYGLIGTYTEGHQSALAAALVDNSMDPMLVAFDYDNQIGAEFEGDPTLYGEGMWINTDGSQDDVLVGFRKDSKEPIFPPAPNYDPFVPASISSLMASRSTNALTPQEVGTDHTMIDRLSAPINGHGESLPFDRRR